MCGYKICVTNVAELETKLIFSKAHAAHQLLDKELFNSRDILLGRVMSYAGRGCA
jgi:hypothetical protein